MKKETFRLDLHVKGTRKHQNHEFCLNNTSQVLVVTPFIVPAAVYNANQPQLQPIMQFFSASWKKTTIFQPPNIKLRPFLHPGQSRPLGEDIFCTCCLLELIQA